MAIDEAQDHQHGVMQATIDLFLDSTRSVTGLVARAGGVGARAVVPDPVLASVDHMLLSLRGMVVQLPHVTDEIDVLMGELNAKRLSVQALTAELEVLDQQLEVLQSTLAPIQKWSRQWSQMQYSLLHVLETTGSKDLDAATDASA